MGGGQAVGFGLGLALGGVFADTVGWRWGFYTTACLNGVVLALALWSLPSGVDTDPPISHAILTRLLHDIDWVGALLISICLALISVRAWRIHRLRCRPKNARATQPRASMLRISLHPGLHLLDEPPGSSQPPSLNPQYTMVPPPVHSRLHHCLPSLGLPERLRAAGSPIPTRHSGKISTNHLSLFYAGTRLRRGYERRHGRLFAAFAAVSRSSRSLPC